MELMFEMMVVEKATTCVSGVSKGILSKDSFSSANRLQQSRLWQLSVFTSLHHSLCHSRAGF